MKRKIALLIFDDVEVLDFAGPFEVFSVADERHDYKLFDITVVAKVKEPVTARNGLSVNPHRTINEVSQVDMLLVPGGLGTRPLIRDQEVVDGSEDRTGRYRHGPCRQLGPQVDSDCGRGWRGIEDAVPDHGFCAGAPLFCGLEYEP